MAPLAAVGAPNASLMIPRIMSSETRSPRSIVALAARPSGVPSRTAALRTSPVAILGMPSFSASRSPWVPFPAPGGPRRTITIGHWAWDIGHRKLGPTVCRSYPMPHAPCPMPSSEPAGPLPSAESYATLLHEPVVLPEEQVLLHLGHAVQRHADHDEQRGAAELERAVDPVGDDHRQQCDRGEEERTWQRD